MLPLERGDETDKAFLVFKNEQPGKRDAGEPIQYSVKLINRWLVAKGKKRTSEYTTCYESYQKCLTWVLDICLEVIYDGLAIEEIIGNHVEIPVQSLAPWIASLFLTEVLWFLMGNGIKSCDLSIN
jgi:hypothetical protein